MADDQLVEFRAASKFAERSAGLVGFAYDFAEIDCSQNLIAKWIAELQSEGERHAKVLALYQDQLGVVADDVVTWAGITFPSAHNTALEVADRLLSKIAFELSIEGLGSPDHSIHFDPALVASHWIVVRRAILLFGRPDDSMLQSLIIRERGKLLEKLNREKQQPAAATKKIEPTPKTLEIIRLIEKSNSNNQICSALSATVARVRKIRSRLENGMYEL